jgi:DnaJ-class molecular chaperone
VPQAPCPVIALAWAAPRSEPNVCRPRRWEMNVSLEQAVLGGEKELKYEAKVLCAACEGRGNLKGTAIVCSQCAGQGRYRMEKTISVKVPPGVNDGSTIRLKAMGEHGVPPGNLLVRARSPLAIERVHLVGSHGRWKRPCLQTARMTI